MTNFHQRERSIDFFNVEIIPNENKKSNSGFLNDLVIHL